MKNFFKKLYFLDKERKQYIAGELFIPGVIISVFLFYVVSFPNNMNEILIFYIIYYGGIEIWSGDIIEDFGEHLTSFIFGSIMAFISAIALWFISSFLIITFFGNYGKKFLLFLNFYKDEQTIIPFFHFMESPLRYLFN